MYFIPKMGASTDISLVTIGEILTLPKRHEFRQNIKTVNMIKARRWIGIQHSSPLQSLFSHQTFFLKNFPCI